MKEHPAQVGVHGGNATAARYPGFYRAIAGIPNVRLIPVGTNTFTLIDRAKTTATVTGTAAWESIMRGKAGIVFGYPWFMHAPGIFRVTSVEECKRAYAAIAEGARPRQEDIFYYLHLLERESIRGSLYKSVISSAAEEAATMHRAIEKALCDDPGASFAG